jgi:hypothetical protein
VKELSCPEAREAAAEFALGVLPEVQRTEVTAHLAECRDRRQEVAVLNEIAARLVDLVPGTEPPLGFDRMVLSRVRPGRRRRIVVSATAAALVGCSTPSRPVTAVTIDRGAAAV